MRDGGVQQGTQAEREGEEFSLCSCLGHSQVFKPWVCLHTAAGCPPGCPRSCVHMLPHMHPHIFTRSPCPCSFLQARAQLESWLPPVTFQNRLFI